MLKHLFRTVHKSPRDIKVAKMASDHTRIQSIGFLHIPKTGGSGLSEFGRKLVGQGHKFPLILGHEWTAAEALKRFPEMKLAFIIRDPLERFVSGFNSRLRMGRPRNNNLWTLGEAVSFSFFDSASAMLGGLDSPDERIKSAALFALQHISHLKHGYQHYFKSREFVARHADRITLVRDIHQTEDFLRNLCLKCDLPPDLVDQHYMIRHVAPQSTAGFVAGMTAEAAAAARSHLAGEYAIYQELSKLADQAANR